MTTYGIPFTLTTTTHAGVLHVTTVHLEHAVPDGFVAVVAKGGPVMLVPTAALTPVDDDQPEQPTRLPSSRFAISPDETRVEQVAEELESAAGSLEWMRRKFGGRS